MRLSSALVRQTVDQFESEPLPDDHPAVPRLNSLFGDHTFFVADEGLHIVEPADLEHQEVRAGQVVKLASWKDDKKTSLTAHDPEPTDVIVLFEKDSSDGAGFDDDDDNEAPEEGPTE